MRRRLAVLLGVALTVGGCFPQRPPSTFSDGVSLHTIRVHGQDRSYRLYKPAGLPSKAPLVVMLHGGFGTAEQAERAYGWDDLADKAKFVVAYPDGMHRAWNTNGGGCCGRPARDGTDDVGFITAAVGDIARNIGVDPSRVYATGISNGGIMSYTLACNTADFAAIGPDSATQLDPCPSPRPTSVIHIHGTADRLIPYNGGRGTSVIDGPSVASVNAFWRNVDRCGTPATATNGPVTTSTAACADHRAVALVTVDGGGHEWPPFATETLWRFFDAHPR